MKTQAKIIELRSKKTFMTSSERRWTMKPGTTKGIWKHFCGYSEEWTTVHFVKETKRGFTFSVFFAGKYSEHFVSRSDCDIVYEL